MKKIIIVLICVFTTMVLFAEKIKVIPLIITTNRTVNVTATGTVHIPHPKPKPVYVEDTATPSWMIATPTASLTTDIGGNQ